MNDASHQIHFRFIDEPIQPIFKVAPLLEKTPSCPDGFIWGEQTLRIVALLAEWRNYGRRGRMATNMTPAHTRQASRVGSWGVGRFFFRVEVEDGRIFEIYYDRAPKNAGDRKGKWLVYGERIA